MTYHLKILKFCCYMYSLRFLWNLTNILLGLCFSSNKARIILENKFVSSVLSHFIIEKRLQIQNLKIKILLLQELHRRKEGGECSQVRGWGLPPHCLSTSKLYFLFFTGDVFVCVCRGGIDWHYHQGGEFLLPSGRKKEMWVSGRGHKISWYSSLEKGQRWSQ